MGRDGARGAARGPTWGPWREAGRRGDRARRAPGPEDRGQPDRARRPGCLGLPRGKNDALCAERLRDPPRAVGTGLREVVQALHNPDIVEPRLLDRLQVLRLHGRSPDAIRPQLRVQPAHGTHVLLTTMSASWSLPPGRSTWWISR